MNEMPTRYRIEVACSTRLRNVLAGAAASCVAWFAFLGWIVVAPVLAQSAGWMARTEREIKDTATDLVNVRLEQRTLATQMDALTNEFAGFRAAVQSDIAYLRALELRTLYATLGLLATAVALLVGVLWNLRSGWLKVKADE